MKKYFCLFIYEFCCLSSFAQAWAMDEAHDDAVESGATGFRGIIVTIIFFVIIYLISQLFDNRTKKKNCFYKTNEPTKSKENLYHQTKKIKPGVSRSNSTVAPSSDSCVHVTQPKKTNHIESNEYTLSYDSKMIIKGKNIEVIHIPQTVEIIKDRAFAYLDFVKEVTIPEGVKEIGDLAFFMSSIERIVLPSTVKKIGECAFCYCKNLKEVVLSDGIAHLGVCMFQDCNALVSVKVPNSIKSISSGCFLDCRGLTNIELPQDLQIIGDDAFYGCHNLRTIKLPDSVVDIGFQAFRDCHCLESIKIPKNIVGLSEYLFCENYNLKSVELPSNLTCIMHMVFNHCNSLKIRLPLSLTHIEKYAFAECYDTIIEVPKGKKEWISTTLEMFRGQIHEYDYEEEYVQTPQIAERTKRFLQLHDAKEKIFEEEAMESMGLSTRDDDFLIVHNPYDDY